MLHGAAPVLHKCCMARQLAAQVRHDAAPVGMVWHRCLIACGENNPVWYILAILGLRITREC